VIQWLAGNLRNPLVAALIRFTTRFVLCVKHLQDPQPGWR
jgi:hypothetical protein